MTLQDYNQLDKRFENTIDMSTIVALSDIELSEWVSAGHLKLAQLTFTKQWKQRSDWKLLLARLLTVINSRKK